MKRYAGYTDRVKGYADLETRFSSYNTKAEGLVADSVTDDRAALNTLANVTMQPNGGQLDIVGVPRIASDLAIPSNVRLNFVAGAYLAPDIGVTVTINGPFNRHVEKKFGGGGTVTMGPGKMPYVRSEWWGGKFDGATDDAPAINAANVAALAAGGIKSIMPAGTAIYGSLITWGDGVVLQGAGMGKTILKQKAAANLAVSLKIATNATKSGARDFTLDMNAAANVGAGQNHCLNFDYGVDHHIYRVEVKNFYGLAGGTGVGIAGSGVNTRCTVEKCYVHDLGDVAALRQSDGIYMGGVDNRYLDNNLANITDTAIVAEASSDPIIKGNTLRSCVQGIAVGAGIAAATGTGGIVADNTIIGITRFNGQAIFIVRFLGTATKKMLVADNIVRDSIAGAGIFVWQSSYVDLSGNKVSGIGGTAADYRDGCGILVRNSDHVTLNGGSVDGCAAEGVKFDGVTDFIIGPLSVTDCMTGAAGVSAGVVVNDGPAEPTYGAPQSVQSQRGTIIGLRSKGASQGRGLSLSGLCDKVLVIGCDLRGNANNPGFSSTATGNIRRFGNITFTADNTNEAIDYALLQGGATIVGGNLAFVAGASGRIDNVRRIRTDGADFAIDRTDGSANNLLVDEVTGDTTARGALKGTSLKVGVNQVVGARGAAVADATGAGDIVAQFNAWLARARAHGLIAP